MWVSRSLSRFIMRKNGTAAATGGKNFKERIQNGRVSPPTLYRAKAYPLKDPATIAIAVAEAEMMRLFRK